MELKQEIQTATEKIWNETPLISALFNERDKFIILDLMNIAYMDGMQKSNAIYIENIKNSNHENTN